jgi:hypothetical protein
MVGKIVAVPGKTCFLAAIHSKPSFTGLAGIFYSFIKLCYLTDNNRGILRILGVLSDIDLLNEANCTGLPQATGLNKSRAAHAPDSRSGSDDPAGPLRPEVLCVADLRVTQTNRLASRSPPAAAQHGCVGRRTDGATCICCAAAISR